MDIFLTGFLDFLESYEDIYEGIVGLETFLVVGIFKHDEDCIVYYLPDLF